MSIQNPIVIIRGDTRTVNCHLYKIVNGERYDYPIGVAATAKVSLMKEDGTNLELTSAGGTVTFTDRAHGLLNFSVSGTNSLLLKKAERQNVLIAITDTGATLTWKLKGILTVEDPGFE